MPIYSFRCDGCQSEFELLVSLSDKSAAQCPQCGSGEVKQLLSRTAPPGKSAGIIAQGRAAAAREGHFSHYSKAEKSKISK